MIRLGLGQVALPVGPFATCRDSGDAYKISAEDMERFTLARRPEKGESTYLAGAINIEPDTSDVNIAARGLSRNVEVFRTCCRVHITLQPFRSLMFFLTARISDCDLQMWTSLHFDLRAKQSNMATAEQLQQV